VTTPPLPAARDLTRAQHDGHACVWCGKPLWRGAVSAGIARGRSGAHTLDVEVYACPDCHTAQHPDPRPPHTIRGQAGSTAPQSG
jgi:hypothetical protein